MAAERDLGRHKGFKIVAVVVRRATAPFGIGGGRCILGATRGGLGRLLGKHIVETGVQRLLDLGAAAEIPVHPLFLAGLKTLAATPVDGLGTLAAAAIKAGARLEARIRIVAVGE